MDPYVKKLSEYFLSHPSWVDAAKNIKDGASSQVFFSHLDGEWHLMREDGQSLLLEGPSPDPDFAFSFTPSSIDMLTGADGDIGDFAMVLFECVTSEDPDVQVRFRLISPFGKLLRRGYVQVLLRGGPRVLQLASSRGVRTLSDLRALLREAQSEDPVQVLRRRAGNSEKKTTKPKKVAAKKKASGSKKASKK